ncbi:MAG: hypothetical protein FJ265_11795 [Planctomycetes bacterium]|nr:hypothetical protein [Planctomycetota bacterium]
MSLLAPLALTSLALFLPQDEPAQPPAAQDRPALLTPPEQATLRDRIVKYFEADEAYARAEGLKDREKANKSREKAREALHKEWEARMKKGNLLASMVDLRAIYDNCFVVPKEKFTPGTMRKDRIKDSDLDYTLFLPKTYRADKPMRTVLVLPGSTAAGQTSAWVEGDRYFEAVWDKTPLLADSIVHVSHLPAGIEMDPVPDFSRDGQDAQEGKRIEAVFSTFGLSMAAVNIDRARVFLDCGRGNCGFGLRFVSMFPDRFAGLVLRQPTAVEGVRLGSLGNVPVLMIKTAATAAVVDALKSKLEEQAPGRITVIEATDEYPHRAAAGDVANWMAGQHRTMYPAHVVIEPNHDRFNKAYWVRVGRMDPLHTLPLDQKPRIEATADRANNRIVIKARGIENFSLLLNDDLVDLDKEITVVINDKAITEKRTRDQRGMQERLLQRRDWDFLFPVVFDAMVPKQSSGK